MLANNQTINIGIHSTISHNSQGNQRCSLA